VCSLFAFLSFDFPHVEFEFFSFQDVAVNSSYLSWSTGNTSWNIKIEPLYKSKFDLLLCEGGSQFTRTLRVTMTWCSLDIAEKGNAHHRNRVDKHDHLQFNLWKRNSTLSSPNTRPVWNCSSRAGSTFDSFCLNFNLFSTFLDLFLLRIASSASV